MSKSIPLLVLLLVSVAVTGVKALERMTNWTTEPSLKEFDVTSEHAEDDPDEIADMVHRSIKNATYDTNEASSSSCRTGNPIDDCWRCDPNWYNNRQRLADCAIGFGRKALGGRNGKIYVVTDSGDYDMINPRPGTLRHAVIQTEPLWIIFKKDMTIKLKYELIMNSYKTIDGRGANVHITNGGCITIQYVNNIIIHGLNIHDCKPTGNVMIRSSPSHYGRRGISDGDAINIFGSNNIWIDHNSLSRCADGLIDVVKASTAITISNNYMTDHDKVILLGHNDAYTPDKKMQVTIAYNHFGEGLVERMPRVRHGYAHVVNNDYVHWKMYAIGGSANPTINSQGNRFLAADSRRTKEVTKILGSKSKAGNLRSVGDLFLNGAYFTPTGTRSPSVYARASSMAAKSAKLVPRLTSSAGALYCRKGRKCVASA